MVAAHADHVICLNKRIIAEGPPRETLKAEVITKTFGIHTGMIDFGQEIPDKTTEKASDTPLGPCCMEHDND